MATKRTVCLFLTCLLVWLSLGACAQELPADGVYTGVGAGMQSNITVEVTVADGKIASVDVISHNETLGISDAAVETIPAAIVEA